MGMLRIGIKDYGEDPKQRPSDPVKIWTHNFISRVRISQVLGLDKMNEKLLDPGGIIAQIQEKIFTTKGYLFEEIGPFKIKRIKLSDGTFNVFCQPIFEKLNGVPTGRVFDHNGDEINRDYIDSGKEYGDIRSILEKVYSGNIPCFGKPGRIKWYSGYCDYSDDTVQSCLDLVRENVPCEYPSTDRRCKYFKWYDFPPVIKKNFLCVKLNFVSNEMRPIVEEGVSHTEKIERKGKRHEIKVLDRFRKNKTEINAVDLLGTDYTRKKIDCPKTTVCLLDREPMYLTDILELKSA